MTVSRWALPTLPSGGAVRLVSVSGVASATRVSTVYEGPGRSTSTRLSSNAGLSAMASSTIAHTPRLDRGVAGEGELAHREPMLDRRDGGRSLVRRLPGRNEQDPLEP